MHIQPSEPCTHMHGRSRVAGVQPQGISGGYKMAGYIIFKLPAGHSFEDIQKFEFKATLKSGGELTHNEFDHMITNAERTSIVVETTDPEDRKLYQAPCIELSTL